MRRILLFFSLVFLSVLASGQTASVYGTGVKDSSGVLLSSGQWCFGASCVPVSFGSFSGTVSVDTPVQNVTVVNASSVTVLTVPNVSIFAASFNWNQYVVPTGAQLTGVGGPYLPCFVGASYNSGAEWCSSFSGQAAWSATPTPQAYGSYIGYGAPVFYCSSPCQYLQIDGGVAWGIMQPYGTPSNSWSMVGQPAIPNLTVDSQGNMTTTKSITAGTLVAGTPISITSGGTGANTAAGALANLGGLPLSGGTLTGALNGTSASFSGAVAAPTMVPSSILPPSASATASIDSSLGVGRSSVVAAYGAVGDNSTDNTVAFQNCINASTATGGSLVCYVPNGTYRLHQVTITQSAKLECQSAQAVLVENSSISGSNDTIQVTSTLGVAHPIGGSFTAGQTSFALSSSTGLSVGQDVFMMLGQDPYDSTQNFTRMFNQIVAITGNTVTLAVPLPEAVAAPTILASNLYTLTSEAQNIEISGCGFDYVSGATPNFTIEIDYSRNIHIHDILGLHTAGDFVGVIDSENVAIENVYDIHAVKSYADAGRMFGGWGSRNISIKNVWCLDCENNLSFFESQTRNVTFDTIYYGSTGGAGAPGIAFAGGSTGNTLKRLTHNVGANVEVTNAIQGSTVTTEDVNILNGNQAFPLYTHSGPLAVGTNQYYTTKTATVYVPLNPNNSTSYALPSGYYKAIQIYMSTLTGVNSVYITNSGQGANVVSALVAGSTIDLNNTAYNGLTFIGSAYPFQATTTSRVITPYTGSTTPVGSYALVTITYYVDTANIWTDGTTTNLASSGPNGVTGNLSGSQVNGGISGTAGNIAPVPGIVWTAVDGSVAGLPLTSAVKYNVSGNLVTIWGWITYPTNTSTANAKIAGLPFPTANAGNSSYIGAMLFSNYPTSTICAATGINSSTVSIFTCAGLTAITNAQLSGMFLEFQMTYPLN